MTTQPEVIRHSDLINQLVLDRNTMEELGRVEVVWMYTPAHKVLGFVCKKGLLGGKRLAFNLPQLHSFGAKSILVSSAPQETDGERVSHLESLINCEVWTDAGNKLGKITDYLFNVKTGDISEYLFTSGGLASLTDGIYRLPPYRILSVGKKRVLIAESAVRSLSTHQEGIKQKLRKAEELLKKDYTQVTQELRSLTNRAHSATEQAKERARLLAEQAKERAQLLNEQLREGTQTLAYQAKEKSQELVEQVKEQAQVIREQLSEEDFPLQDPPNSNSTDTDSVFDDDWDTETTADKSRCQSVKTDPVFDDDWDIETPPPAPTPLAEVPTPARPTEATPAIDHPLPTPEDLDHPLNTPSTAEETDNPAIARQEATVKTAEVVDEDDWDIDFWDLDTPTSPTSSESPRTEPSLPPETITVSATEIDAPKPASESSSSTLDQDDEPWI